MGRYFLFLAVLLSWVVSANGGDRHTTRHMSDMEFLAPLGTHKLGDLFLSLAHLNEGGKGEFPKVKDDRLVTLRPGSKKRSFMLSPEDLLKILDRQVKLFDRDYRWEASRHSFRLIRKKAYEWP